MALLMRHRFADESRQEIPGCHGSGRRIGLGSVRKTYISADVFHDNRFTRRGTPAARPAIFHPRAPECIEPPGKS